MSTIGEQLKVLRTARDDLRREVAIVASEQAEASQAAKAAIDQARQEVAEFRAELAEITNGAPEEPTSEATARLVSTVPGLA